MSMVLGEGWHAPPPVEPAQWHLDEPELTTDDLRYEQLMVAMEALKDALLHMPAPRVEVAAPDLSAIVTAVTQLKGNATADDIARAVVSQITPGGEPAMDEVLGKLVKALERLDFRMKGGMGGGGVAPANPDVTDRPLRQLGVVTLGVSDSGGGGVSNPLVTRTDVGTYGITAGTGGATAVVPSTSRVQSIAVTAPTTGAATVTINALPVVTVPAGQALSLNPNSNLRGGTIVIVGSSSYVIETVG